MSWQSKRQEAYWEYLESDHWKAIRGQALDRDGHKCVKCGSVKWLQVHHLRYRGRPEDTELGDLETLCRHCHRQEHGIGPSDFDDYLRILQLQLRKDQIPTATEELRLVALAVEYGDEHNQTLALFRYVAGVRIGQRQWDTWMKKGKETHFKLWPWAERKFARLQALNEKGNDDVR